MIFGYRNNLGDFDLAANGLQNWLLDLDGLKFRVKAFDRYQKPGVTTTGDKQPGQRQITIRHETGFETDAEYKTALNALFAFFTEDKFPCYIIDTENERQLEIEMISFDDSNQKTQLMKTPIIELKFILKNTLWEDIEDTIETGTWNNEDVIIINNTCNFPVYPIIELVSAITNNDLTIWNITNGQVIEVGTNAFTLNQNLILDSQDGRVYIDDGAVETDIPFALNTGSGFLRLEPGNNSLQFLSALGSVDYTITYKKRYAW